MPFSVIEWKYCEILEVEVSCIVLGDSTASTCFLPGAATNKKGLFLESTQNSTYTHQTIPILDALSKKVDLFNSDGINYVVYLVGYVCWNLHRSVYLCRKRQQKSTKSDTILG